MLFFVLQQAMQQVPAYYMLVTYLYYNKVCNATSKLINSCNTNYYPNTQALSQFFVSAELGKYIYFGA
jgi:hypothetical protein